MADPAPAADGLVEVARYERRVHASLERVWENVRDWEHLPWLHRESFRSIALEDEGPWGWRARIGLRPAGDITLELVIDDVRSRYVSRTLEGPGARSEIWTTVTPVSSHETDISVSFQLPGVAPESRDALGQSFVTLYTRLWDEDEAMMRRRTGELALRSAGPHRAAEAGSEPLELGPRTELEARLPLCVRFAGRPFRIVKVKGELVAHSTLCPHLLGPLEDAPVEDGVVTCPWHGYAFDVRTRDSTQGRRLRLAPAPTVRIANGQVSLVAS